MQKICWSSRQDVSKHSPFEIQQGGVQAVPYGHLTRNGRWPIYRWIILNYDELHIKCGNLPKLIWITRKYHENSESMMKFDQYFPHQIHDKIWTNLEQNSMSTACKITQFCQALANVPIFHITQLIFQLWRRYSNLRYLFWWCETKPQKGTSIPTPGKYRGFQK